MQESEAPFYPFSPPKIALMLQGKYDPHHKKELEQLVAEALSVRIHFSCTEILSSPPQNGEQMLQHEDQKKEFKKHVLASKLKELDLENAHTMGSVGNYSMTSILFIHFSDVAIHSRQQVQGSMA